MMRIAASFVSGVLLVAACQTAPAPALETAAEIPVIDTKVWQETRGGPQHIASNMLCPLFLGSYRFVDESVFDTQPHGDNVSCGFRNENGDAITLFLTRFADPVSPSSHFRTAVRSIEEVKPVLGESPLPNLSDDLPIAPHAAAFSIGQSPLDKSSALETAVWLDRIGEWHVKVRATYRAEGSGETAEAVGALYSRARLSIPGGVS